MTDKTAENVQEPETTEPSAGAALPLPGRSRRRVDQVRGRDAQAQGDVGEPVARRHA